MVTPDGRWAVEVIRTRGGEVFRVRERATIGAPIGKIRSAVAEVAEVLGDDFGELVYKP
jgi:hypothetical protein